MLVCFVGFAIPFNQYIKTLKKKIFNWKQRSYPFLKWKIALYSQNMETIQDNGNYSYSYSKENSKNNRILQNKKRAETMLEMNSV